MKLEVYNQCGDKVQEWEYEASPYNMDMIRSMTKSGFSFKLDGKVVALRDCPPGCPKTKSQPDSQVDQPNTSKPIGDLTNEELLDALIDKSQEEGNALGEDVFTQIKDSMDQDTLNTKVKDIKYTKDELSSADPNKKVMIRCVETGKLYNKQSHAARDLGIDPSAVSDSIKTGRKRKGYTFEKVLV